MRRPPQVGEYVAVRGRRALRVVLAVNGERFTAWDAKRHVRETFDNADVIRIAYSTADLERLLHTEPER